MATPERALDPQTEIRHPEGEVVFGTDAEHKCATCRETIKAGNDALLKKEPVIDQLMVNGKIGLQPGTKEIWRHYPECTTPGENIDTIQ